MTLRLAGDNEEEFNAIQPDRPAKVCGRGDIRARIWADPTPWGDVEWRVSFARFSPDRPAVIYTHAFERDELADLIQATFDARRWIARAERRIRRYRRGPLSWF